MGRPPKLTDEQVLDAALVAVAEHGKEVTTAQIAERAGVRVGALYYRYPNREVLLLALWQRSITRFQVEFLAALRSTPDPRAALVAAAVAIPTYCRAHPAEARALTLFRHEQVLQRLKDPGLACPPDLAHALEILNDEVFAALAEVTEQLFGTLEALDFVRHAVQLTAYGLVRPHLGNDAAPMPTWLEPMVEAMTTAALSARWRP